MEIDESSTKTKTRQDFVSSERKTVYKYGILINDFTQQRFYTYIQKFFLTFENGKILYSCFLMEKNRNRVENLMCHLILAIWMKDLSYRESI